VWASEALAGLFGHGDDDHPLWLLAVRINVLAWAGTLAVVGARRVLGARRSLPRIGRAPVLACAACTLAALVLRFWATANLLDHGGIPYTRLLTGYRGYFGTAQAYSLFYALTRRDLDHGIWLDRIVGAATVPVVFLLCRRLRPRSLLFPVIAAGLLAFCPVHILFSASDSVTIFSGGLFVLSTLLVLAAGKDAFLAGALGLALLTQVRYEDVLLALPAIVLLGWTRRWWRAAACAAAALAYLPPSLAAGISYEAHGRLAEGGRFLTSNEVLFNPFLALPFLFAGTLLVALSRRPLVVAAAMAPWLVATGLTAATAESPHQAARIASNWLVPITMASGYGFSLLAERGRLAAAAAAVLLIHFAARPVRFADALRARYLEMAEHQAFASMLDRLPPDTAAVVVPDDELLRRRSGVTVETLNKYVAIRAARTAPGARIIGLTSFLEHGDPTCDAGHCAFFEGLPCLVESVNPFARPQCDELARTHPRQPIATWTVVGMPFEPCSVQTGYLRRDV
jgi:hypothetical protein